MGMYQTIDDEELAPDESAPARPSMKWVVASMAVAFLSLVMFTVLSSPVSRETPASADALREARTAYLLALAEPSPALRRARLSDFAATYPDSDRADAVRAQLSVLNAREGTDWAKVTDALYDRGASRLDRIAALDTYESVWGANLLGGRADEIARLRQELSREEDSAPPSRALEDEDSPIPDSIQAGTMAGGPVVLPVQPEIIPVEPVPLPPRTNPNPVETPPKILRSPTPRYPSRAQRRGIPAVVTVEMDIDRRGRVDDVRIVSVNAERYGKEFARAAERAAKRTRFSPRALDGQAVPTIGVRKRYRFEP